jgi:protein TonB
MQPPPRPVRQAQAAKKPEGVAAKKAEPSPIVAPAPKLPVLSPIPAAKVAGTGSASSSGAAFAGSGTGAGGNGAGLGGGGAGFTPPRQITRIPDREYRRLAATGLRSGAVGISMLVNADGSVSNCRVTRSSGNSYDDALMCELILGYLRFDPARDPHGRPIAYRADWYPRWWRP